MTRRRFYIVLLVAFVLGIIGIVVFPAEALTLIIVAVPLAILAAAGSVVYLRRVYGQQPKPRSRFFATTLETFYGLLVLGGWVGYLTVARVTERAQAAGLVEWTLPAPAPNISAPVSGLLILVVFAGPTRFALNVWRARRRSVTITELDRATELDREDQAQVDFPANLEE